MRAGRVEAAIPFSVECRVGHRVPALRRFGGWPSRRLPIRQAGPPHDWQGRVRAQPVISTEERNLVPRGHRYFVYLLTGKDNKVMYLGVTNDIKRRLYEHKNKMVKGFTERYNVNRLVYYEETSDILTAIAREKEIKRWRREKKDALVAAVNPEWKDLSEGLD